MHEGKHAVFVNGIAFIRAHVVACHGQASTHACQHGQACFVCERPVFYYSLAASRNSTLCGVLCFYYSLG